MMGMAAIGAYANILFALWLISSPLSHGYGGALLWNDVLVGVLVLALSASVLLVRTPAASQWRSWAGWSCALLGLWLTFAPLAFWAETPVAYSNETLLGFLIAFGGAWMAAARDFVRSPHRPPDWTYNPSEWSQRVPIITLAFIGFLSSRYMASYQLGHIDQAWDPFFGDQTMKILTSDVSRAFPVSDAGLGAFSYLVDALSGSIGGRQRWRTMPWAVVLFGFLIVPPGVTSITLVVLQPLAVGAWCTLCLVTAVVMLLMVPPAVDEVVATFQYLNRVRRQGGSLWHVFWHGESASFELSETEDRLPETPGPRSKISVPLLVATLLGTWIMFMPGALDIGGLASDNTYLVGALVVTFAIISQSEVCRPCRIVNWALGIWFAASMWFLPGADLVDSLLATATGLAVTASSFPLGPVAQTYGSYDRWVRWNPLSREKAARNRHDQAA